MMHFIVSPTLNFETAGARWFILTFHLTSSPNNVLGRKAEASSHMCIIHATVRLFALAYIMWSMRVSVTKHFSNSCQAQTWGLAAPGRLRALFLMIELNFKGIDCLQSLHIRAQELRRRSIFMTIRLQLVSEREARTRV
jgi:hypothetical protein